MRVPSLEVTVPVAACMAEASVGRVAVWVVIFQISLRIFSEFRHRAFATLDAEIRKLSIHFHNVARSGVSRHHLEGVIRRVNRSIAKNGWRGSEAAPPSIFSILS